MTSLALLVFQMIITIKVEYGAIQITFSESTWGVNRSHFCDSLKKRVKYSRNLGEFGQLVLFIKKPN